MQWICNMCGHVYDGKDLLAEADDYVCPLCDADKTAFEKRDVDLEIKLATNEINNG